jgi:mannose-1-phosphate guanylyltransferase/mannose-6-phosphate isomerase
VAAARRGKASRFHAVLLAGGSGTRFWPLSRATRPKQFLSLAGRRPLIVETWRRMRRLASPRRRWVVAPAALEQDVRRALPGLARDRLILEPSPRDTGPAVGLACATVALTDPGAIVGIFPTDHVIREEDAFLAAVRVAERAASGGALVCLGIKPDRPATGFGYLKCSLRPRGGRAVAVERFVEKPDEARARRFLRSGKYLWNAGMFVWRAARFLDELGRTAPAILRAVRGHLDGRARAWGRATRLSVDYAVMEKAKDVKVVPLDAGWDDVGSWDAAGRLRAEAGLKEADHVLVDSAGSTIYGAGRLIAIVDLPGVAVVDTPDALLVVSRSSSEKVRRVVDELRKRGRRDLL